MYPYSFDSSYLYSLMETTRLSLNPFRFNLELVHNWLNNYGNSPYFGKTSFFKPMLAACTIAERLTRQYNKIKPEFNITGCLINGTSQPVQETILRRDTFCHLLHFAKPEFKAKQPKLLIVAPMAGHHATLLRGTVLDTLSDFDVYITDWINASQISILEGCFDLDDFIDYIINYIRFLGPDIHLIAVCQPTVALLAATAIMAENNERYLPKTMTLIGGPIDASQNPTKPDSFASKRTLEWFNQTLITTVPANYPGYGRRVYPGFLQLSGFIALNPQAHINSHLDFFIDLINEDEEKISKHIKFYDEYFAVMDLTAEFYLQTIKEVFQNFSLAKKNFVSRGRKVNLGAITNCALLGIEGEKDDISAVGQTKAALNLCTNIPDGKKFYYLQPGVGHYGSFSGSKFRNFIVPKIKEFIYANN